MPLKLIPPRKDKKAKNFYVRGSYLGQYVDRSTKTGKRAVAAKVLKGIEAAIERGEFAGKDGPTFASAALAYMQAGGDRGPVTKLLNHWGDKPLHLIDQTEIDAAALVLFPNHSPATRNREVYTPASAILKNAGYEQKIRRPKGSRGRVVTDWLWPEQAERFIKAAKGIDPELGIFLVLLCYTGLRLSEALNLSLDRLRLDEAYAFIPDTKNENARPVFLPPVVVAALANHPRGLDRPGQKVFRFRKNGRIYVLLNRVREAAGKDLAWVNFHTFRHTWATWMRRYAGLDTKGLVGTGAWRDEQSASRYAHVVVSEEARKAVLLPVGKSVETGQQARKRSKKSNV